EARRRLRQGPPGDLCERSSAVILVVSSVHAMAEKTRVRGRKAASIENRFLHVVVLEGGGHIAAIVDKATAVNPLWIPNWPSIDPSAYDAARHPEYGTGAEARLLSGIMGHNICLDFFGGPSAEEEAAGLTVHGEAPVAP